MSATVRSKLSLLDISDRCDPLVAALMRRASAEGLSMADLSKRAGLNSKGQAISAWKLGKSQPTLPALRCVAEVLGLRIALLPAADKSIISPPPRQDQVAASGGRVTPSESHTAANLSDAP